MSSSANTSNTPPPGPKTDAAETSKTTDTTNATPDQTEVGTSDSESAAPVDAAEITAETAVAVQSDGSPLISEADIRDAVAALKTKTRIVQLGGYSAATVKQLKVVVDKLYKRGLLDTAAAEAYEDGAADDEADSDE